MEQQKMILGKVVVYNRRDNIRGGHKRVFCTKKYQTR